MFTRSNNGKARLLIYALSIALLVLMPVASLQAQEEEAEPLPEATEVSVSESLVEEVTTEEPASEPVIEEPTSEPVTEEPTSEPVTQEPVTEEPTSEPVTEEPTIEPEAPATPEPVEEVLPEEPALFPLFGDNFDSDIYVWTLGAGWSQVSSEGGKALLVSRSGDPLVFAHDNIQDVAIQARFRLQGSAALMSARYSGAGSYTAWLGPDGSVALLRHAEVLAVGSVGALAADQWHTLRLSAIGDIVRVAVNGSEVIAVRDEAPLPAGTIHIAATPEGSLAVDDFELWIPDLPKLEVVEEAAPVVTEALEAAVVEPRAVMAQSHGPLNFRPFRGRVQVKILTVAMFELGEITGDFPGEAQLWVEGEHMERLIDIPGMHRPVYCNTDGHCLLITGVGFSQAASSLMAVGLSKQLDLSRAYILIAGIAGVDPNDGTLGSAAWADYVIDGDLAHEIDAREMPPEFDYPYFQLGCVQDPNQPFCPQARVEGVEVFQLNTNLVNWAYHLTEGMTLIDNPNAIAYRANYPQPAASSPPSVIRCDSFASGTYWHGEILSGWANWWASNWTNGAANYCMTNQEDSATLTALARLDAAGLLNFDRVLVLRTASNFDQPYPGQTPFQSLGVSSGGFLPSVNNAYLVGSTVTDYIKANWNTWRNGPPPAP